MAKLLASEAAWAAADMPVCRPMAVLALPSRIRRIERKYRETRLYQVAPISTNLILAYLAEHVLDLPRSY